MDQKKAGRIRRRLAALRARKANVRHRELAALARAIGRLPDDRGKEPTFVLHGRPPLTIPNHPRGMSPLTVESVLDLLEDDLAAIENPEEEHA